MTSKTRSDVIRSFEYEAATRRLLITFQTGKRYTYEDVPEDVHLALQNSPSKGEYFNAHIREHFTFVREPH
jgi:lysyl-tRNA synthetase class 2